MSETADETFALRVAAKLAAEALNAITAAWVGDKLYIAISGERGFWSAECPDQMVQMATEWAAKQATALAAIEGVKP